MYYGHDVGHAKVAERLGLARHLDFLERFQDRMIGMHIHGVKVLRDHFAPFVGDFDLGKVMPFIRKDLIKVIEASHSATKEELKEAIKKLTQGVLNTKH